MERQFTCREIYTDFLGETAYFDGLDISTNAIFAVFKEFDENVQQFATTVRRLTAGPQWNNENEKRLNVLIETIVMAAEKSKDSSPLERNLLAMQIASWINSLAAGNCRGGGISRLDLFDACRCRR